MTVTRTTPHNRREVAFDELIARAASRYGVPFAAIKAIIARESEFSPWAWRREPSGVESHGLMQLLDATAKGAGYSGPRGTANKETGQYSGLYDPATNIDVGARHFAWCYKHAKGDVGKALSIYNGGASAERRNDGKRITNDPAAPFINQAYVDWVRNRMSRYSTGVSWTVAAVAVLLVFFFPALAAGALTGG